MTARLRHAATPANRDYCLQLLRAHDHENYLANLLHPRKIARFLHISTRALNVELANIRASVSNEDLGRLRLEFFRDGLNAILSGAHPPSAPVLDVLAEAFSAFPEISFSPLYTLLDARERDLAYPSISSLEQLCDFAAGTQGSLIHIHAHALCAALEDAEQLAKTAVEAGKAVGLAIILRGVPAHAATRLTYMPRDLAREMNVPQQELLIGGENAKNAFEAIANVAETHAANARELLANVSSGARPAFWPLYMADIYLRRLKKVGFDPFNQRLQMSMRATYSLALQTKLLGARMMGR